MFQTKVLWLRREKWWHYQFNCRFHHDHFFK